MGDSIYKIRKMAENNKILRLLSVFVLFVACVMCTFAQVTVDVKIDSLELFVGEQTGITLEVSSDAKSQLIMPQYKEGDVLVPGVEVVEAAKPDTQMLNEGARRMITQRYIVTSFDSSFYYLPPFEVLADSIRYESNSLALRVLTVPVDTIHLDQYFPPKEIRKLPFVWADWKMIFWLSVLLILWVAGLVWLYIRYRDNKPIIRIIKRTPKLPPHTAAMQEIEQIKAEKAWAKEDSKDYYTRLTAILRTYIEQRYGFNAMEMTSGEIIERLLSEQTQESLSELRSLFQTADLVKFAKYSTLINENDKNLVNAIEFINQTKKPEDVNAKPEPDEQMIETQRSKRVLISMRVTLISLTVIAAGLLAWIIWQIYYLVS